MTGRSVLKLLILDINIVSKHFCICFVERLAIEETVPYFLKQCFPKPEKLFSEVAQERHIGEPSIPYKS